MLSEAWTHYGERKGESRQTDDYICGERRMTILAGSGYSNYDDNNNGTDPFPLRHQTVSSSAVVAVPALKSSVSKTSGK